MEKIDVVIVGAGLSGLACAYRLAENDVQTIVVERGDFPGSKNVTGGRIYHMPIKDLSGNMLDDAPFERKVVREGWSLLGEGKSINVDFTSNRFVSENHSYTILRAKFDRWLSEKVGEKGVFVIPKYRVDDLIREDGKIIGIKAGPEEIYANVVVAADGVLSFMAEKAGLRVKMKPGNYAVGIKEIISLPEEKINDRFNVEKDQGCAHLFLGEVTKGAFGGGFLYTNKETISIGVVAGIKGIMGKVPTIEIHTLIDDFKKRYEIERLIDGGKLEEYAAHIIPEAGYSGVSGLCDDGILVVGDAAGFALNMGVTVRGMEFAVASGILAADTIIKAREAGNYSKQALSLYETKLRETFVMQDMITLKDMPKILDDPDYFSYYPKYFPEFVEQAMWFGKGPKQRIGKTLWKNMKDAGMVSLKQLKRLYGMRNI